MEMSFFQQPDLYICFRHTIISEYLKRLVHFFSSNIEIRNYLFYPKARNFSYNNWIIFIANVHSNGNPQEDTFLNCKLNLTLEFRNSQLIHITQLVSLVISVQKYGIFQFLQILAKQLRSYFHLSFSISYLVYLLVSQITFRLISFYSLTQIHSNKSLIQCGVDNPQTNSNFFNQTNNSNHSTFPNHQQNKQGNSNNSFNSSDGDDGDDKNNQRNTKEEETQPKEIERKHKKPKSSVALFIPSIENEISIDDNLLKDLNQLNQMPLHKGNREDQVYIDDSYLNIQKSSIAVFDSSQINEKVECNLDGIEPISLETNQSQPSKTESDNQQSTNLVPNECSGNQRNEMNSDQHEEIDNEINHIDQNKNIECLAVEEVYKELDNIKCFEEQIFTFGCLKVSNVLSNSLESLTFDREMEKEKFEVFIKNESDNCIKSMYNIKNDSKNRQETLLHNYSRRTKENLKQFKKNEKYIFNRLETIDLSISENYDKITIIQKKMRKDISKAKDFIKSKLEELRTLLRYEY